MGIDTSATDLGIISREFRSYYTGQAWGKRRYEAAFVSKPCPEPVEGLMMQKQKRLKLRRGLRLQ
jgi:hypothetical protein